MFKYLSILLICSTSYGGDLRIGGGLSNNDDTKGQRLFRVEYLDYFSDTFMYKFEEGVFNGINMYIAGSVGLQIQSDSGIFARYFLGPSYVFNKDTRLASPFEFNHDLELGIRDKSGLEISMGLKHMSNAGLVEPNPGRDFITINLGFHF